MEPMEEKAKQIKTLFLDVDGVLTDGRVTLDDRGVEIKSFHSKDGQGLKMLVASGIEVVIITGRSSNALAYRARELGIEAVYQGVGDKRALCRRLIAERGLKVENVASMGDDLPDLGMMLEAGLRMTVNDAAEEVREMADFITRRNGGQGAVREVSEWLLKCQGKWLEVVAAYAGK
ncbi:KdsC family phosphatase [Desulfatiglans anilini]|uniref:KdsC family phosphatase n=1 Tax=Desulfatiglans anilini TaxID=90728 RepID=UPI0003F8E68A|nr:HAD hydrolase family protein [Desulfatiglans anilini]